MSLPLTAPAPVDRIRRTSVSDPLAVLVELEAAGRLADGAAHIVSVDAIRQAFGVRWPERRVLVWEMTESQLQRRLPAGDLAVRIGDTDFLIVATASHPLMAQGVAVQVLRDILTHFLGEALPRDVAIRMVTAMNGGELVVQPLAPEDIAAADRAVAAGDRAAAAAPGASAADGLKGEPLTTFDGRRLRVSLRTDPVIDLTRMAPAGHRVEPLMLYEGSGAPLSPAERMQLMPSDMERVDLASLERVASRLDDASARKSLILCVSFLTVTNMRARTRLFLKAQPVREALRASVIWELGDVAEGAPVGRLTEVFTLLKPYGRGVFLRVASPAAQKTAQAAGVPGMVAHAPPQASDPRDAALWLLQAGKTMHRAAPTLVAANLQSVEVLPVAAEAGFTHAAIRSGS